MKSVINWLILLAFCGLAFWGLVDFQSQSSEEYAPWQLAAVLVLIVVGFFSIPFIVVDIIAPKVIPNLAKMLKRRVHAFRAR